MTHHPLQNHPDHSDHADTGALRLQHGLKSAVRGSPELQGYEFPWGQVVERPGVLWVWDFYLERLQTEFEARGLGLVNLQERVFAALETQTDYAVREHGLTWQELARDAAGWRIVPAALGHGAVFSVFCHAGAESSLRNWLVGEFLPEILPAIQQAVLDGLEQA